MSAEQERADGVGARGEPSAESVAAALAGMMEMLVVSQNNLHKRQIELEQRMASFDYMPSRASSTPVSSHRQVRRGRIR